MRCAVFVPASVVEKKHSNNNNNNNNITLATCTFYNILEQL